MIQPICVLYIYISVSLSPETSRGSECLLLATRRKSWPAFSPWDTTPTTSLPLSPCSGAHEWHSMKSVYQCTYSLWGSGLSSLHFFLFTVTHFFFLLVEVSTTSHLLKQYTNCGHLCVCTATCLLFSAHWTSLVIFGFSFLTLTDSARTSNWKKKKTTIRIF